MRLFVAKFSVFMLKSCLFVSIWSFLGCKARHEAHSSPKFYGTDNQLTNLDFTASVEVRPQADLRPFVLTHEAFKQSLEPTLRKHASFTYGAFKDHPAFQGKLGTPENLGTLDVISVTSLSDDTLVRVTYRYRDQAIFHTYWTQAGRRALDFYLPTRLEGLYAKGLRDGKNLCSDDHYNSEADFYYSWNPWKPGCPLTEDDYVRITGTIDPLPRTTDSYPYYDALYGDNGNGRTFKTTILVGSDSSYGWRTLDRTKEELEKELGIAATTNATTPRLYTFRLHKDTYDAVVEIRGIDKNEPQFLPELVKALEDSDLLAYAGHSGDGDNLHTNHIRAVAGDNFKMPPDKQQIIFFNTCLSWPAYARAYFQLKAHPRDLTGAGHLDVLTTADLNDLMANPYFTAALVKAFVDGTRPSWKHIVDTMHQTLPELSSMVHVIGDEENPKHP